MNDSVGGAAGQGMKVRLVANKVDLEASADQEVVEAAWHQGYHLVMTHSLPWRIPYKWWVIARKIIYKWAILYGYVK